MMGNVGFHALRDLGKALRDKANITTFIETGTYKAETTQWAATEFNKVVTVEAHGEFYNRARKIFRDNKSVRCVFGDSLIELPEIIKRLRKPTMIWLDAHKCRFEDSLTASECPLLDELRAIKKTSVEHLILIDDARMFIEPPPKPYDPAQWPDMNQIKAALPSNYYVTVWHDAVIAVPSQLEPVVTRFTKADELSIVVLTSNNYVHCMPAFCYLFNKFWDAAQSVQVVRYDVRPPKMPGNFTNFAIGIQDDYEWSSGLKKYLAYHPSDLILLMLEDYFISQPVDKELILNCWRFMMDHSEVAKVDLSGDRLKFKYTEFSASFVESALDAQFQTSLQAAIWRKDYLLRFLRDNESAWQFEKRGTKRVIQARQRGNFDGVVLGCRKPPLTYINDKGGEGNHPHLWDFKKFPDWMKKELRWKRLI
jgi:hypothetical protein